MKRLHVVQLGIALFIVGFASAFLIARSGCSRIVNDMIASDAFGRSVGVFETLRDLRAGDTNAVLRSLEQQLDTGIVSINALLEESPNMKQAENCRTMLRRIGEYRVKFPHRSADTNMEALVTEALVESSAKTKR